MFGFDRCIIAEQLLVKSQFGTCINTDTSISVCFKGKIFMY